MTDPKLLLRESLQRIANDASVDVTFTVEYPRDTAHGDVATNLPLVAAATWPNGPHTPRTCAEKICELLQADETLRVVFADFSIAGPGFINGRLQQSWLETSVAKIVAEEDFGRSTLQAGTTILIEFTDPNPFKEFHIGHLMSNSIGEAMARLQEWTGATVHRLCYQGDVGMHIAKALWGMERLMDEESVSLHALSQLDNIERVRFLGRAYAAGARAYDDEHYKKEIHDLNAHIYDRSDDDVNERYDAGRAWSLAYFEEIYARLGTHFTTYYFESETGVIGRAIVEEFVQKGVFIQSEGAVIFPGEEYGLHNRVFLNAKGLPTYEAKELGLATAKKRDYPSADISVVVTGSEVQAYFAVVKKALAMIDADLANMTVHKTHGMLRLTSGKMSSRTGDVVAATALLDETAAAARARMHDGDDTIADYVGIAAIKYAVLKQTVGKDIVYDPDTSLAFEGNTGPYLQYTYVRTASVLRKARETTSNDSVADTTAAEQKVQRLLYKFPNVIADAAREYAPSTLCTYLYDVAAAYNELYASEQIVGSPRQNALLQLTTAVGVVLGNGLTVLGIPTPERL